MLDCYKKSKNKLKDLAEEIIKQDKEAKRKIARYEKVEGKLKVTQFQLKRLYEELVKPLFSEIKVKDEIIERKNQEKAKLAKDLKMLNSIIRVPRLCSEI